MMHDTSRAYMRNMLQARLEALAAQMASTPADDIHAFAETAAELRTVANSMADLMTHHVDERAPTPETVEPNRETVAALQLYKHVMRSADTIRDLEIALGLSEKANTKPHNLMRDMRTWVEKETLQLEATDLPAAISRHNGKHKRPHLLTEATG